MKYSTASLALADSCYDDLEQSVEVHSYQECATLLRCSPRDVMMVRLLALKRQSSADGLAEEIPQS
jgi:hypothetical protein